MKRLIRLAAMAALSIGWTLTTVPATTANEDDSQSSASSRCHLGRDVKHVVNIVFDNTHLTRDNPNVPSDLEQMPALRNFLEAQGTLLTNEHTPLIAHTATDILTSLTGVYGDRMGVPISNSFRYYLPNGTTSLGVSFAYWTAPLFDPTSSAGTDTTFNMVTQQGKNAPAPWVPFTRAGCNVGGVSTANIELENVGIDIPTVFGAGSPQAAEAKANPDQATADFVGIAVHCARTGAMCSDANGGRPDLLPDEPGGYSGFQGLFGHKYVAPAVGGIKAIDGTPINGFPGFDAMPANNTLGYVAQMLEHGVPVTYGYISDAHAGHTHFADRPFGPGEADYVNQLKEYDQAFASFFARLAKDGINRHNTIFVFTSDEGDHLIAGPPTPANCDGVHTPCTYAKIGEVSGNLKGLTATQFPAATTAFTVHSDSAPTIYITGNPGQSSGTARDLERAAGTVTATNPYSNNKETVDNLLADQSQMQLLHMLTSDAKRNPTFTMFGKPDYFLFAGAPNCNSPCVSINPNFNWNHGDIAPEINTTWLGVVGPGVKHLGATGRFWTDHSDIRPTLMALTRLKDDYAHQGRPITEIMSERDDEDGGLSRLAFVYKQINAPVGQLSLDSVRFSTKAMVSSSAGDFQYTASVARIQGWTSRRDALAAQMIARLDRTGPNSHEGDEDDVRALIAQGRNLLAEVHAASL
ncbi:MAG TPA: sulfatase-like hydrolase/transferase [Candidatus Dormibacteraeota bacterium]|nr:sulfatase-like hydrolase/transferase [Candidatus Dormibacteraeota bacterium]